MSSGALDELVELLHELRDPSASVLARAGVARRLFQLVAGLQPLERRELMIEVAARAAPDLAERLTESTGVEVTSEQLTALAEAIDQLEPHDVDALIERLGGPEQRRETAEAALRDTGTAVASAIGLETEPEPEAEPEPDPQPVAEAEPEPEPVLEPEPDLEPEPGLASEPEHGPELEPEQEPGPEPDPMPEPGPEPGPEPETEVVPVAAGRDEERSWFTGRPLGIAALQSDVRPADRVAQATTAGAALRTFRSLVDDIAALAGPAQGEVLRAIPDGWARRRALETLIRAGGVARADVPSLLTTLSGRWPRTWVVGTLLEEEMIDVDQLDELVDPETAGRLRRRVDVEA